MSNPGPLALIGGGEWSEGCSFDAALLETCGAKEIVVVPAAAAYEHPERTVARAEAWFRELGVKVTSVPIVARPHAEDADIAAQLREAAFIYIPDGSPLHLRSVLKDSAAWHAILQAWHNGCTLACSGAAATVVGDPMVDPRGGTFTLGLGIIRGLAVVPQWERWTGDRARRMNHLIPRDVSVAEIEERTALIRWSNGDWQSDGFGRTSLRRNHQPLDLSELESTLELSNPINSAK